MVLCINAGAAPPGLEKLELQHLRFPPAPAPAILRLCCLVAAAEGAGDRTSLAEIEGVVASCPHDIRKALSMLQFQLARSSTAGASGGAGAPGGVPFAGGSGTAGDIDTSVGQTAQVLPGVPVGCHGTGDLAVVRRSSSAQGQQQDQTQTQEDVKSCLERAEAALARCQREGPDGLWHALAAAVAAPQLQLQSTGTGSTTGSTGRDQGLSLAQVQAWAAARQQQLEEHQAACEAAHHAHIDAQWQAAAAAAALDFFKPRTTGRGRRGARSQSVAISASEAVGTSVDATQLCTGASLSPLHGVEPEDPSGELLVLATGVSGTATPEPMAVDGEHDVVSGTVTAQPHPHAVAPMACEAVEITMAGIEGSEPQAKATGPSPSSFAGVLTHLQPPATTTATAAATPATAAGQSACAVACTEVAEAASVPASPWGACTLGGFSQAGQETALGAGELAGAGGMDGIPGGSATLQDQTQAGAATPGSLLPSAAATPEPAATPPPAAALLVAMCVPPLQLPDPPAPPPLPEACVSQGQADGAPVDCSRSSAHQGCEVLHALSCLHDRLSTADVLCLPLDPVPPISGPCPRAHQALPTLSRPLHPGTNTLLACSQPWRLFPRPAIPVYDAAGRSAAAGDALDPLDGGSHVAAAWDLLAAECVGMGGSALRVNPTSELQLPQEVGAVLGAAVASALHAAGASAAAGSAASGHGSMAACGSVSVSDAAVGCGTGMVPMHRDMVAHAVEARRSLMLRTANDALYYSSDGSVVQAHRSAAIDRLAALARICRLEATRADETSRGVLGRARRASRSFTHALELSCPEMPEGLLPYLRELGEYGCAQFW